MNKGRTVILCVFAIGIIARSAAAGPANVKGKSTRPQSLNLDGFGEPLPAVQTNSADMQTFAAGQLNFKEIEQLPELGPLFNSKSCAGCHFQPVIGGGGLFIGEIRVRNNSASGPVHIFAVDNMLRLGPQSQGDATIFPNGVGGEPLGCQITAPGCQLSPCQQEEAERTTFAWNLPICDPTSTDFANGGNCSAGRESLPVWGLGLVEAVADSALENLAASEPSAVQGVVKQVTEFGRQRVARFGWKDDHATLRAFAGDAYLNEIGITNPDFPNEISQCATNSQGAVAGVALEQTSQTSQPSPEDSTDPDGRADIDRFSDFMRALNPPPQLAQDSSARNGATLFTQSGCADCHTPSLTTDTNPAAFIPPSTGGVPISNSLNAALANKMFHPYSDFLLHDMGSLGDGITSGSAGPTMMRTPPLWGVRAKSQYLHDGRASDLPTAISLHSGQGSAAADKFKNLTPQQQQDLVNYLNTL